jgi:hypothetical protein
MATTISMGSHDSGLASSWADEEQPQLGPAGRREPPQVRGKGLGFAPPAGRGLLLAPLGVEHRGLGLGALLGHVALLDVGRGLGSAAASTPRVACGLDVVARHARPVAQRLFGGLAPGEIGARGGLGRPGSAASSAVRVACELVVVARNALPVLLALRCCGGRGCGSCMAIAARGEMRVPKRSKPEEKKAVRFRRKDGVKTSRTCGCRWESRRCEDD